MAKRTASAKSRQSARSAPAVKKRFIDYPRAGRTGVRRWLPSWKLILGSAFSFVLLVVGGFAAAVAFTPIPQPNDLARSEKTIVYYSDGETELGRLGEANRINVSLDDMATPLKQAVLAAEDREFYDHGGFDPGAIARAAWNDIRGGDTQGASTITQQYAKNAYLSHEQTIVRKVKELVLSVRLETEESKDQILENYLNTIYFGRGSYGVETASLAYFGKPAKNLNLRESAALAAIVRAPGGYDPETNRKKLQARFKYVLRGMAAKGWIPAKQVRAAQLPEFREASTAKNWMQGTNGYLLDSVQREMIRRGYTEDDLNIGGFRITTTYDKDAQEAAVEAVEESGISYEEGLRIGLTSVRAETGEVIAMYGGRDYLENQLSNADQAVGLAGSTFKPFGLAAAFEQGIDLDTRWDGSSPRTIQGYTLRNEGNASYGDISLLTATSQSVNTVFVDLGTQVGPDKIRNAAVRAGVPRSTIGLTADPTTVLGTASPTTLDMAGAYATFANRGMQVPTTVLKQVTRGGSVEIELVPKPKLAFEEDVADEVNYALQNVVTSGTGYRASAIGRPAAGKTGTSDNNKSAWFVGYTPQISTAVMLVKEDSQGNATTLYGTGGMGSVYGGSYPAKIWAAFMAKAVENLDYEEFEMPADMSYDTGYDYYEPSPSPTESSSPSPSATESASPSGSPSSSPSASPSSTATPRRFG